MIEEYLGGKYIVLNELKDLRLLSEHREIKGICISPNCKREVIDYFMSFGDDSYYVTSELGTRVTSFSKFCATIDFVDEVLFGINEEMSDLEKARYIELQIGKRIGYNVNSISRLAENYSEVEQDDWNFYNAISEGKTICRGFCDLFQMISVQAGLDVHKIKGINHIYNALYFSEDNEIKATFIDVTHDIFAIQAGLLPECFGVDYAELQRLDKNDNSIRHTINELDYSATDDKIKMYNEAIKIASASVTIPKKQIAIMDYKFGFNKMIGEHHVYSGYFLNNELEKLQNESFVLNLQNLNLVIEKTQEVIDLSRMGDLELSDLMPRVLRMAFKDASIMVHKTYTVVDGKKHFIPVFMVSNEEETIFFNYNKEEKIINALDPSELKDSLLNGTCRLYKGESDLVSIIEMGESTFKR